MTIAQHILDVLEGCKKFSSGDSVSYNGKAGYKVSQVSGDDITIEDESGSSQVVSKSELEKA